MAQEISKETNQGHREAGRFCYAVRKPAPEGSKQRNRAFGLAKVQLPKGTRVNLDLPEIDTINKLFLTGVLSHEQALKQIQELRDRLYKERDAANPMRVFNSQNQKVLDDYWQSEYADRDIVDLRGRRTELEAAVEGVGMYSLAVASKEEIQGAVNSYFTNANKQRRVVSRLNQILKYLGRGFVLRKKREVRSSVKYLSLEDFTKVLPHIRDEHFRALCCAAWATGGRLGELFPLTPEDLKDSHVWIETQLAFDESDRLEERGTKTGRQRKAFIIMECRDWVKEWIALGDYRVAQRRRQHAELFRTACKNAFPGQKDKHLKFHDLRHSYAIHLLQVLGAPIQLVANSLGNSTHVCEKYYAGFVLTDPGIDFLERLSQSKKV